MFSPSILISKLRERAAEAGLWRPETHRRGDELLRQGAPCGDVVVLTRGLAKLTYLTPSGDEWIKSFIVDEGLFGALDGDVARFGAFSIEPCTIARLPMDWIRSVADADPAIAAAAAGFGRWLAERKQAREEALLCETAETRYRGLLLREPRLIARLPQGDVARYLRVTPVAFSRIKRRVRDVRM